MQKSIVIDKGVKVVFWLLTLFTLFILFFILGFILKKGLPVVNWEFLTGNIKEMGKEGGIFPTIIGTIYLTLLGVAIATPLGVGTSIYLVEYTRENKLTRLIRFGSDCLAGIPSIIFGMFGFVFFVITLKFGWSLLSGALTLSFMVLPTIIRTSEEALKAVPQGFREVSLSLGAGKWQTVVHAVLPRALPGILTGIVLSVGRCVGETAAVIFTAGAAIGIPRSLLDSARTMSVHFYILAREGISEANAYGTAVVLVGSILILNIVAYTLMHRYLKKRS